MDLNCYRHYEQSFATDNTYDSVLNGDGRDFRSLDTSCPPLPDTAACEGSYDPLSWFSQDELSPAIYSQPHSASCWAAQPADTSPDHPGLVIKRNPASDDVEEDAWKAVPNGTITSGNTGDTGPQMITNYDDSQLCLTEFENEDFFIAEPHESRPLNTYDRQGLHRHTSAITAVSFGEMIKKQGSYLYYTRDAQQRLINFRFDADMPRGFFEADDGTDETLIAYRQRYFEVACSLTLEAFGDETDMQYVQVDCLGMQTAVPVDGLAIGISAFSPEKRTVVDLVQFKIKRDKAGRRPPKLQDLELKPRDAHGDALRQQNVRQRSGEHVYRRLQFSKSTTNNSPTRPQNYFQVRIILYVKTKGQYYIATAYRDSPKIIVRGRSFKNYIDASRQRETVPPATSPFDVS